MRDEAEVLGKGEGIKRMKLLSSCTRSTLNENKQNRKRTKKLVRKKKRSNFRERL